MVVVVLEVVVGLLFGAFAGTFFGWVVASLLRFVFWRGGVFRSVVDVPVRYDSPR